MAITWLIQIATFGFISEIEEAATHGPRNKANPVNRSVTTTTHEASKEPDLNVVVVLETVLDVAEELEDVDSVDAGVEQGVHALEGSFAEVKAVVNLVLERTHLDLEEEYKKL